MTDLATVVSRLLGGSSAFNTLTLPPPVPIFIQKSPGNPAGDTRGVVGLDFQVVLNGAVIQTGRTGTNGRIDVRVPPGGSSIVQLMSNGAVAAEYEVTVDDTALDAATTDTGHQERLRLLGYQVGHTGTDGNGVDGTVGSLTERSILDFQADQGLVMDAVVGPISRGRLTAQAGG